MAEQMGTFVSYQLTQDQADDVNRQVIAAGTGSYADQGQAVPMLVIESKTDEDGTERLTGRAFPASDFVVVVASATQGTEPGQWDVLSAANRPEPEPESTDDAETVTTTNSGRRRAS